MIEPKIFYRRHLPHYQPPGATFHVVFRLKGSLPAEVVEQLRVERGEVEEELTKTAHEQEKQRLLREHR